MEIIAIILLILPIVFFFIVWFNFIRVAFIKIRISKKVEEITSPENEKLNTFPSSLDAFRLIEKTPVLNEFSNQDLNDDIELFRKVVRRLKIYGLWLVGSFIVVFVLTKMSN